VSDFYISSSVPIENHIKTLQYILMWNNYYIFQIKIVINLIWCRKLQLFSNQLVASLNKYKR
jgi:hypothetical protein